MQNCSCSLLLFGYSVWCNWLEADSRLYLNAIWTLSLIFPCTAVHYVRCSWLYEMHLFVPVFWFDDFMFHKIYYIIIFKLYYYYYYSLAQFNPFIQKILACVNFYVQYVNCVRNPILWAITILMQYPHVQVVKGFIVTRLLW